MVNFTAPPTGTIRRAAPTNPISAIFKSIIGVFVGIIIILLLAPTVLWFAESQNTAKIFSHTEEVDTTSGATGYIRTREIATADVPMACYKTGSNCLYYNYKLEELQYTAKDYCGEIQSNQQILETKGVDCHRDSNDEEVCEQCYRVNESNWNVIQHEIKFQPFVVGNFRVSPTTETKIVGAEEYNEQIDTTHKESMEYLNDNIQLLVAGNSDGETISQSGKKYLLLSSLDYQATYDTLKAQDRAMGWILRIIAFIILFVGYNMIFGPISTMSNFVRKIPFLGKWIDNAVGMIIFAISFALAMIHFILLWILIMIIKNILWIALIIAIGAGIFYLYTHFKKQ